MLIAIIGENCVGKTTLANKINQSFFATVYSGKDYLRLEKNPSVALEKFKSMLKDATTGDNVIYLITESEHLKLLPDGAFKIVLTADLQTIKLRFKERMRGNLPMPVEKMLEAKHGAFDNLNCNLKLDGNYDINDVIVAIKQSAHKPVNDTLKTS